MENAKNADDVKRQAVVIIHGIGEQRPMDTLRAFVNTILLKESGETTEKLSEPYYSKPDTISDSYELRRIKLKKIDTPNITINADWTHETDFFEYYWASHMSGTEWRHVFSWMYRLFKRSLCDLRMKLGGKVTANVCENDLNHKRLIRLYLFIWTAAVVAAVAVAMVFLLVNWPRSAEGIGGTAAIASVAMLALIGLFRFVVLQFLGNAKDTIGDAARYLDLAPANISRRYEILRGGKDMLRNLHTQTSQYTDKDKTRYVYDRIVIVGHSLGSVIAYDLLRHYWYEVNGHLSIESQDQEALNEAERFCCPENYANLGQTYHCDVRFRRAQYNLWRSVNRKWLGRTEFRSDKAPRARWLITDFITLGSPLSYGTVLLADTVDSFKMRAEQRELPICPPNRSRHIRPGQFVVPLDQEATVSPSKSYDILHHGAMFAVTRWTNFYFKKDLIAGRIKNVFGKGIRDIELKEDFSWFGAHTSYWDSRSKTCLDELRAILKDVRRADRPDDKN